MNEPTISSGPSLELRLTPILEMFVGRSTAAQETRNFAAMAAPWKVPVLLQGDSGTGKTHLARLIHEASGREGPFVRMDCGEIPEALMESELYGHTRGAFTSADRSSDGLVTVAKGGTLFIDEIGNMGWRSQAGFLRLLEGECYRPVGGRIDMPVQARIVAATNADLRERVEKGTFREDLFFRMSGLAFVLPPLRNRVEDIPELVPVALKELEKDSGESVASRLTLDALEFLAEYHWPGNVRELVRVVQRAHILKPKGHITACDLRRVMAGTSFQSRSGNAASADSTGRMQRWREVEREYYEKLLHHALGNVSHMAAIAGVGRPTIDRKMRDYNLGDKLAAYRKERGIG